MSQRRQGMIKAQIPASNRSASSVTSRRCLTTPMTAPPERIGKDTEAPSLFR